MTIQWDEIEQKALDTVAQHTKSHEAAALANTKKVLWFVSLVRSSVVSWLAVVTLRMIALITVVAALVV